MVRRLMNPTPAIPSLEQLREDLKSSNVHIEQIADTITFTIGYPEDSYKIEINRDELLRLEVPIYDYLWERINALRPNHSISS
jgi:hypothetical protein